ncbi:MAG: GNAT family N-acetyltransferase [Gloeobacteraceae cyanobacterium ES-bin-316]|nr:GNAT family N-acetyltransferase [Ferruginibacter sp.]
MLNSFSNPSISFASEADLPALKNLLNIAYRGESSRQGWTTEADIIAGDVRTDDQDLIRIMQLPNSIFLKYLDKENEIRGCVNLQQHGQKIYLGMFSVSPVLQGLGIGKQILKAAEEYALGLHCIAIYMSVISVRPELIAWYKKNAYAETGERKAFNEDGLTGKHRQPLEFLMLEKNLQ